MMAGDGMEVVEIVHCSASRAPSDDAVGFRHVGRTLHLWVIDGATSVSAVPNKADPAMSDAAWFARALSAAIHRSVGVAPLTPARLATILRGIEARFRALAGAGLEPHDWPVAAMTYAAVRPLGRRVAIEGLHYADCFLETAAAPASRPAPAPTRLPSLPPDASLPKNPALLAHLRERRGAQVERRISSALTIRAESAGRARRFRLMRPSPLMVLLGSDGFARLWDAYRVDTLAGVARRVARHGALRQMLRLRDWERANPGHGREIKPADDATMLVAATVRHAGPYASGLSLRRGPGVIAGCRAARGRRIGRLP